MRRSLDDLSEDLSRESYGRRREISLRLAFISREESLAERLRRWTRKSQESLDRIFSQIQPTEDASGLQSSLCNVFHKAIQEAEALLESLNGQPSLTDDSPGSVARIVAAQEIVSSLTRELQVETDRRLQVASMVIQHGYAEDATNSETDDLSSSSSASQDAMPPINGDTQSPQVDNELVSPTDQVANTPVSAPADVVTDAAPLTPSAVDDTISPSHLETETPPPSQLLPGDDVQIPVEAVPLPDEPLLSFDSLTLAAEPSSDSIVAISIISPSILDIKQLSVEAEDKDATLLSHSNETTALQAQSIMQDAETLRHIPEQSGSHPDTDTVTLEEPSVVAAVPASSHVPPTALSLPPSATQEDEKEWATLSSPHNAEPLDPQSTSPIPVDDDDIQAAPKNFSPIPDVAQSEEVPSVPITPIIESPESPAPLPETTSMDSVSSGSNVEVNIELESHSLALPSELVEEADSGTSPTSISGSDEESEEEILPPPVVVVEPIDVSEDSEPVLIPDVEVAESAMRSQTADTEPEKIESEERSGASFGLKVALVDLDVNNEPQTISSDASSDPLPASIGCEPEHKSLLTNSKNRASPPSPLALTPSPVEELSPIVASSSPITPEPHVNDIIFPSINSEQSHTDSSSRDPRISYLLQNLTLVKHRYDDLQKSFRDCHLALKETKNTVASLSSSHPLFSILPTAVDRLNDFNEDARVELEIRIADEERIYAGYETLLSIPGAFSDEVDKTTLEAEIEAFIDGSDKAVDKAMKKFTKQLEDLQHDIASIKRAIHDPPSEPEPPTPASPPQPSISTPQKSAAWASWAGGLLGSSRPSSPATPARTFGSVMTSPRVRHTSFSHSTLSSAIGGFQSQLQQEPATPNPFANLSLRISMPAHLHIPSHIPPTLSTLAGSTNHLTPSYLPPSLLGSSTTNPNAGSVSSPGLGSSTKPRTAMYMLGLGSRGGGGLGLSGGRTVSLPGGRNSPLLSSALSLGSSGLGKTFPRMMAANDTPTSRHDTSNTDDLDSDVE